MISYFLKYKLLYFEGGMGLDKINKILLCQNKQDFWLGINIHNHNFSAWATAPLSNDPGYLFEINLKP